MERLAGGTCHRCSLANKAAPDARLLTRNFDRAGRAAESRRERLKIDHAVTSCGLPPVLAPEREGGPAWLPIPL